MTRTERILAEMDTIAVHLGEKGIQRDQAYDIARQIITEELRDAAARKSVRDWRTVRNRVKEQMKELHDLDNL